MKKMGFDNKKYLEEQKNAIMERVAQFDNKLYLEFGGKLLFDYHASRVLPGFDPNVKMRLLQQLSGEADIILCIYAGDIERKKVRADFGITYDADVLKLIDDLRDWNIEIKAVVITRYEKQPAATIFKKKLERQNIQVYTHMYTSGYPTNIDLVVSDDGYGANEYIETESPLVVVTGPGPGSGKMATCLSQVYHENKRGIKSGYAKFETFPIWNIPLKHPVNIAYEAATADIADYNLIDPFHLEAYDRVAINYNRDVESFPVLKRILQKISGAEPMYLSPTDMGVNRAGFGITDDELVKEASRQEIIRRFFRYSCEYAMGFTDRDTVQRVELLMDELDLTPEDRVVVKPARQTAIESREDGKGNEGIHCGAAILLHDGTIITGKNSPMLHATPALILNAIKTLAGIPDNIHLLSPGVIDSIRRMKGDLLGSRSLSLDLEETLIALAISAGANPTAHAAMEHLPNLQKCEMHMTHMPTPGDDVGLRKLGINVTSDPSFSTRNLLDY